MNYPPSLSEVQSLFPELSVIKLLGKGGQKSAFEVTRGDEHLVLKVFSPATEVNRVLLEIEAMQTVDSPHVARLVEFHVNVIGQSALTYLLEEFIEGESLGKIRERGEVFEPDDGVRLIEQLLLGLSACWEHKIVHRDIKPDNIMIASSGNAVIIDLGIARHTTKQPITPTGVIWCTPKYAAPEVLRGQRNFHVMSDLFSLGIVAYELLTGVHPLWLDGVSDVVNWDRMMTVAPTPPYQLNPKIDIGLSNFIMQLLEKERSNRFRTPELARARLLRLLA